MSIFFKLLKELLVNAPVIVSPDWSLAFELKCDVSDTTVGENFGSK